jgi:uncharacterized coiled-coil protein SlyX
MNETIMPESAGCPRCGIGTPIFGDSCIVCCAVNDSIASLIKELLARKLAAEAKVAELEHANEFAKHQYSAYRDDATTEYEHYEAKVAEQAATIERLTDALIDARVLLDPERNQHAIEVITAALNLKDQTTETSK